MSARVAADALVALHALFVVFVVAGGALVVWRPWIAVAHLPAALWGAWIELSGNLCPLTPLENRFRRAAGQSGYEGGFIEHYVVPVLYPDALTPRLQVAFGLGAIAINGVFYALAWRRARRRRR